MSVTPRVSVGLPVHNGARYLTETLESILAQEFGDFELIISDNASTDGTREICETYAQRDPRITYSRLSTNVGASGNYNRVFRMSQGELFKWAAHDDLLHPAFLARCVEAFDTSDVAPALVYPKAEFIDENGDNTGPDMTRMVTSSGQPFVRAFEALHGMSAVASAVFGVFQASVLEKTRLIDNFFASDCVLMLEIALLGRIMQLDGPPLFQRRLHPGISTKANVSHRDRLHWYDPTARARLSPGAKLIVEYVRSPVRLGPLSPTERSLSVLSVVLGVSSRKARVVLGGYRRSLAASLARRSP
jgi:glycosyltransferase involved in cell wall biosynthesis